MSKRITESKNMNSPSNDIIIIKLIHIFPNKFVMLPQPEGVNMNFRGCSKNISFCASFFQFIFYKNLYSNCINSIVLIVCEVNNNILKAVVRSSLENDWLMSRFVPDVSNMSSSEFKKLRMSTFLALKEI